MWQQEVEETDLTAGWTLTAHCYWTITLSSLKDEMLQHH